MKEGKINEGRTERQKKERKKEMIEGRERQREE